MNGVGFVDTMSSLRSSRETGEDMPVAHGRAGAVAGPVAPDAVAPGDVAGDDLAEVEAPSRRSLMLAGLAAVALLGGGFAVHRWLSPAAATQDTATAQSVSVIVPGRISVEGSVTASGVLAARHDLPVGIAGEGGRVVQVLVDAGDWVRKGQVMAVVDRSVQTQEMASQAATVEVQQANARLAQSKLDRSLKLVSNGFISNADIDQLVATRDAAVAQVRVARAALAQLRASAARLDVVAPEAGLVLTRQVEPGQIVGPSSGTLFRVARDGELEMQARLSESNLARMAVGDPAQVTPVGTTHAFTGHIWQLAPTIDATTREGIARIALPFDRALRPGGFATATLRAGITTAPVLPESAILSDPNGAFVYVVGNDNKAMRRPVATGDVTPRGIVVLKGLDGTERVVLRAGGFLNPGDKVQPVLTRPGDGAQ